MCLQQPTLVVDFFQIEVESSVIAAGMNVLGMNTIEDEKPTENAFPEYLESATKQRKKEYINKIATVVVDTFIIDQQRNTFIEESVKNLQTAEAEQVDADGRFHCRFPGCDKTFAHKGKLRKEHEASHDPPVVVNTDTSNLNKVEDGKEDDMLAYQRALLHYGILILNFWDAISEAT